ncbi:hypothetical protein R3P38DRAFT_1374956 [Favolaschia claudopus]|uniref:Uncharacterized protein n=1 Tax=Favolaschia claudopus TaxID=2862362 RepID=A0AAW0DY52_9AGAR
MVDLVRSGTISPYDFCTQYQLDDDVLVRLKAEGISNTISLFYYNEEGLKSWGFNAGSIAEIRAALKQRLADKHPNIMVVTRVPQNGLDIGDINMDEFVVVQQGLVVKAGRGEAGWKDHRHWHASRGAMSGPHIIVFSVALFRQIDGGTGSVGGDSTSYGVRGGDGSAPELANLILSISEETRRKIPRTPLEDLDLAAPLLKLLKDNGFRTVGGLLELMHTADLVSAPGFKPGFSRVLEGELDRFCSKYAY